MLATPACTCDKLVVHLSSGYHASGPNTGGVHRVDMYASAAAALLADKQSRSMLAILDVVLGKLDVISATACFYPGSGLIMYLGENSSTFVWALPLDFDCAPALVESVVVLLLCMA